MKIKIGIGILTAGLIGKTNKTDGMTTIKIPIPSGKNIIATNRFTKIRYVHA